MTIKLTEPDRQIIVGAIDTLGKALADHSHTWTAGEHTIYNSALEILGVIPKGGRDEMPPPAKENGDDDTAGEGWKKA